MRGLRSIVRLLALAAATSLAASAGLAQEPPARPPATAPVAAPAPPHKPTPTPPAPRPAPPTSATVPAAAPVAALPPGARLAAGQPIPPAELEAFVDGVVRQAMAQGHIAGVTVSVVQNGQALLKKGYGFADLAHRRPVDPDLTLFRIGSISKTFTWILVMKQVEAGRMSLDRSINLSLPEALRVPDQGFSEPVRVRDLMNHTPGFEDRLLGQLFEKDYDRVRPLQIYLRQERPRRVREPETLPSYSNYGAALAGAAVVEVTGVPFERLVETQITDPLGMAHTTFREPHPARKGMPAPMPPEIARDVSTAYHWTPAGFQARSFEYIGQVAPAGAGSSTAGDMTRYMLMLLNGGTLGGVQVYGPLAAQAFATPLRPPTPGVDPWRHGFSQYALPGGFTGVGHDGGTLSFLSNMVVVPNLGLGVFISTNTDTGGPLAESLAGRVVEHFYAPTPPPPPAGSAALVRDRAAFEGVYLTDRRAYHGLEGFVFRIVGAVAAQVTADGKLLLSGMGGAQRWAPVGAPAQGVFVGEDGPAKLVFQMRDGRAMRFFPPRGAVAYERVGFFGQTGALILLSAVTAIASIATLGGVLSRARRDLRESTTQQRAGLLQASQAVLWLLSMILMGVWTLGTSDLAKVMYEWPGALLMLASACALVAALMAAASLIFLPFVWRGGRRVDSWTGGRKARFTATAVIFLAYAVLLASWGALEPWSG